MTQMRAHTTIYSIDRLTYSFRPHKHGEINVSLPSRHRHKKKSLTHARCNIIHFNGELSDVNLLFKLRNIYVEMANENHRSSRYLFRTEDNCSAVHLENANSVLQGKFNAADVGQYNFSRNDECASIYYAETEHILHQQLVPTRLECLFRLKYQLHVRVCRLEFVSFWCILLFFIYLRHVTPRTDANENDWPLYSFVYAPIHTPTYWPAIAHYAHSPFEFKRLQLPNAEESRVLRSTINMRRRRCQWRTLTYSTNIRRVREL